MGRIVEIRLDENSTFFAEVSEDLVERLEGTAGEEKKDPVFRDKRDVRHAHKIATTVNGALSSVKPVVDRVVETFHNSGLSQCQIAFGLKLHDKVGAAFVSEGSSEAHLRVTLQWQNPTKKMG
ncbi:MAG TPA: hypothetical protein HPQ00_05405 [Magnetococcales bacterium]|nr:hypothetical protein [Magnetococcales bacterium]